jgi:hypothetical protein
MDQARLAREVSWLVKHPEYEEMPATIEEFLGPDYLNFPTARPGLIVALKDIFGEEVNAERISEYERAMVTGAIGIGKTTFASVAIPYMVHHTLCLKDPQGFYGLGSGTRIAFMQMSTSTKQAVEVIFGDLKARIEHSPWFTQNYPFDPKFTKQMRFAKDIWILPGGSSEKMFEGYNILGGILDEMDSHQITENKDYADVGFDAIENRISSRFPDFSDIESEAHRGLVICIGQMKKSVGFASRKFDEFQRDPKAYVVRQTIWESYGWARYTRPDGTRASFWYNTKNRKIVPSLLAEHVSSDDLMEIPLAYKRRFETNPEKALRDLAGIPPITSSTFMSLVDRIEECSQRWTERVGHESPVRPDPTVVIFEDWFKGGDPRKRVGHIDFAKGKTDGDALGMGMGYVDHIIDLDGEKKPYIIIDFLARLRARPGTEIMFADVRRVFYHLKEDLKFRVKFISVDGYQAVDTYQQFHKRHIDSDELSVDKTTGPYEDLRDAIYERRIEFPKYMTYMRIGDDKQVEVVVKELMELVDDGKKIDHPPNGSKDVADVLAAITSKLMGDRGYQRGVGSQNSGFSQYDENLEATGTAGTVLQFPGQMKGIGLQAPVPPNVGLGLGLTIPDRLKPRGR